MPLTVPEAARGLRCFQPHSILEQGMDSAGSGTGRKRAGSLQQTTVLDPQHYDAVL